MLCASHADEGIFLLLILLFKGSAFYFEKAESFDSLWIQIIKIVQALFLFFFFFFSFYTAPRSSNTFYFIYFFPFPLGSHFSAPLEKRQGRMPFCACRYHRFIGQAFNWNIMLRFFLVTFIFFNISDNYRSKQTFKTKS